MVCGDWNSAVMKWDSTPISPPLIYCIALTVRLCPHPGNKTHVEKPLVWRVILFLDRVNDDLPVCGTRQDIAKWGNRVGTRNMLRHIHWRWQRSCRIWIDIMFLVRQIRTVLSSCCFVLESELMSEDDWRLRTAEKGRWKGERSFIQWSFSSFPLAVETER